MVANMSKQTANMAGGSALVSPAWAGIGREHAQGTASRAEPRDLAAGRNRGIADPQAPDESDGFMAADAAVDVLTPSGFSRVPPPYKLLQVSPRESDPVRVILAAQIQLRRWRSLACCELSGQGVTWRLEPRQRILEIVAARDAMLQRIRGRRFRA